MIRRKCRNGTIVMSVYADWLIALVYGDDEKYGYCTSEGIEITQSPRWPSDYPVCLYYLFGFQLPHAAATPTMLALQHFSPFTYLVVGFGLSRLSVDHPGQLFYTRYSGSGQILLALTPLDSTIFKEKKVIFPTSLSWWTWQRWPLAPVGGKAW